jgi:penicillin-binding protein 2
MSALKHLEMPDLEAERRRFQVVVVVVLGAFIILALRLWYLQLIRGEYYRTLSENNRIRVENIPPPRGTIFDRHGTVLVDIRPGFSLAVIPEDIKDMDGTLTALSQVLGYDKSILEERVEMAESEPPFRPIVLVRDMTRDQLAAVESHRFYLPGVVVQVEPRRSYEWPAFAAHLIGYVGEIDERQLKDGRFVGYRQGDYLGKYGVEQQWERVLNGQRGGRQVEVDSAGRQLRVLREAPALPGQNLILTLDANLQRRAEEALSGKAGAIVALDPNNGDILAMASTPAFDQNRFIRGLSTKDWQGLIDDPMHPLNNKAIQGAYPPGSTFKPVVDAAALEEGVAEPGTILGCQGQMYFGHRFYRCWEKKGHGRLDLYQALVRSCDVYHYQLGLRLGVDRMAEYARRLGYGSRTLIGLSNESRGLVPNSQWKLKRFGIPWQKGEDLSISIGQGFLLVTPLQQAVGYATLVNGGKIVQPRIVQRVESPEGAVLEEIQPQIVGDAKLKPTTMEFLRRAMTGVVQDPGGTGKAARLPGILVGGKTGTAQVVRMADNELRNRDLKSVPYEYRDHAWFVCFAPAEAPRIVVAVLVEHGGHGGSASAPLARQVLEEFFQIKPPAAVAQKKPAAETGETQED